MAAVVERAACDKLILRVHKAGGRIAGDGFTASIIMERANTSHGDADAAQAVTRGILDKLFQAV